MSRRSRGSNRAAGGARPCVLAACTLLGLVLAACGGGPATLEVTVDRGTEEVVGIGEVQVRAQPGDTVRIVNGNRGPADAEAPATVTHAFVGVGEEPLPPTFISGPDSATPNPAVWGICRGGAPADADMGCPTLPVEGPTVWDGTDYWSLGAMLPGESRELVLAEDIALGEHALVCVLHPELRVIVAVTEDGRDEVVAADPPPTIDVGSYDAVGPPPEAATVLVGPVEGMAQLNRFVPAVTTVAAGATVTWISEVRTPHDVTFGAEETPDLAHTTPEQAVPLHPESGVWDGDGEVRSGYLSTDPDGPAGQRFSLTFGEPGTYAYFCRFHPAMTGTVEVR